MNVEMKLKSDSRRAFNNKKPSPPFHYVIIQRESKHIFYCLRSCIGGLWMEKNEMEIGKIEIHSGVVIESGESLMSQFEV